MSAPEPSQRPAFVGTIAINRFRNYTQILLDDQEFPYPYTPEYVASGAVDDFARLTVTVVADSLRVQDIDRDYVFPDRT